MVRVGNDKKAKNTTQANSEKRNEKKGKKNG
jgi:hypothetical protein